MGDLSTQKANGVDGSLSAREGFKGRNSNEGYVDYSGVPLDETLERITVEEMRYLERTDPGVEKDREKRCEECSSRVTVLTDGSTEAGHKGWCSEKLDRNTVKPWRGEPPELEPETGGCEEKVLRRCWENVDDVVEGLNGVQSAVYWKILEEGGEVVGVGSLVSWLEWPYPDVWRAVCGLDDRGLIEKEKVGEVCVLTLV